ncbi:alcohol dehydrogenase catalytic domain-containing protein [Geodermatophilus sp. SYSU D01036]
MCRSDWHAWAGHDDEVAFPHVPGHELAGVVAEVGAEVTRWRAGDRVTVPFVCGCGRCAWCRAGEAQVCPDQQQPGFTHWGSFAEYVALHAADTTGAHPRRGRRRERGEPGVPVRHGLPRPGRPRAGRRGGVGHRGGRGRRRPERGGGRPRAGGPGWSRWTATPRPSPWPPLSARSTRCGPTDVTSRPPSRS